MKSLIEALERRALLTGEIDTTFGTNGVVTSDFDLYSEQFTQVTTGPNGSIYAAGFIGGGYLVAKYTSTGQLDTTFGGTGFVKGPTTNMPAEGLAVSPAGKVYVAGEKYVAGGVYNACVLAFNADGTPDTTFDGDGVWTGTWAGGSTNGVLGAAYANDRLYLGTFDYNSVGVASFTPAGTLDSAFDGDGLASYPAPGKPIGFDYEPSTFGNGPLVVASRNGNGLTQVVKFNLNGTRDTAFSVTPTTPASPITVADHIDADGGGRVLVSGTGADGATIVRLTNTGQIDPTFGVSGSTVLPPQTGTGAVTSLVNLGNTIVVTRASDTLINSTPRVTVLTGNGQRNYSVGDGGIFQLATKGVTDSVASNGGVVFTGRLSKGNDQIDTQLARINPPAAPRSISGTLFDDVNGDGLNNDTSGRTTFYGISAYFDFDNSGTLNGTEPTAYAGNGRFVFDNVGRDGTYTVRLAISGGINAVQTYPTAGGGITVKATNVNTVAGPFGVQFDPGTPRTFTVSGTVFVDKNKNGAIDGTEVEDAGLVGWYVYVDTNNNGDVDDGDLYVTNTSNTNRYTLTLPADGKTYRVQVRNDNAPNPFTTASSYSVSSTTPGVAYTGKNFGISPGDAPVPVGASASGIVFDDANNNGKQDPAETGRPSVLVYIDVDNDKVFDGNEAWQYTDTDGSFSFSNLPDTGSATRLRASIPTDVRQTTPVDGKGYGLTLTPGAVNRDKNFGLYLPPPPPALGSLSGFAFDDSDKDGVFDSNETKTGNKTIFLDVDNDGVLDSNEKKTTTAGDGSWSFTGLAAGTYHVRRVFPSGYTLSTPLIDVNLAAGQAVGGLAIGSKSGTTPPPPTGNTASIGGSVFNDNNKNGKYDSGDGYAKGVIVFLDADNDGKLDSGETSVTTDGGGKFNFTKLTAGTYRVRRVMPSGYAYSTTKPDVTLAKGQAKSGVLIGTKKV